MTDCRFCSSSELRCLVSYPDYPIFIGCSDRPRADDQLYNFSLYLCNACGAVQQLELPSLNLLYGERRFFGGGRVWREHYDAYHEFIAGAIHDGARLLEVGGGTGAMLSRFIKDRREFRLADVEPHPEYDLPAVVTFRNYFDLEFETNVRFDAIYSSHLIEHLSDVHAFFAKGASLLQHGGSLFTACPNILESFRSLHLNAFTTDHFNYFSPEVLRRIAYRHGFSAHRYRMFRDHGMYFEFKQVGPSPEMTDRENAKTVDSAFDRYIQTVNDFAAAAASEVAAPVYLYGAHAFTITFLRHLPRSLFYRAVLDNEPTKQFRRLCGTDLQCLPPSVLADEPAPTVIMYMGAYMAEIVEQLKTINPAARLIRLDEFAAARPTKALE